MIGSVVEITAPFGFLRASEAAVRLGVTTKTGKWVCQQRLRGGVYHRVCLVEEVSFNKFLYLGYSKKESDKPWTWVENVLGEIFPEGLDFL